MELKLGENIRTLRKEAGLTQEQLAEALGVTTGAVYKWESGRAMPELELLIEIGTFFETSVDTLLGYGWEQMSMGQAAERLAQYIADKDLAAGMRYAEKALQKYPNSFPVVLKSAEIYFLTMEPAHAARAIELYQKAVQLIGQNKDPEVGLLTIQNRIASCYCRMDRMADAVALLKQNNVGGINNWQIGFFLSQDGSSAEEALKYLSEGLLSCYSQLYNLCMGYANAYEARNQPDEITALISWLYTLGTGLRDSSPVCWMDKYDVLLFSILAKMDLLRGNAQGAYDWLKKAGETARRFDAAPEYRASAGMRFYYGNDQAASYDDIGETAVSTIENFIEKEAAHADLRPIWAQVQAALDCEGFL